MNLQKECVIKELWGQVSSLYQKLDCISKSNIPNNIASWFMKLLKVFQRKTRTWFNTKRIQISQIKLEKLVKVLTELGQALWNLVQIGKEKRCFNRKKQLKSFWILITGILTRLKTGKLSKQSNDFEFRNPRPTDGQICYMVKIYYSLYVSVWWLLC